MLLDLRVPRAPAKHGSCEHYPELLEQLRAEFPERPRAAAAPLRRKPVRLLHALSRRDSELVALRVPRLPSPSTFEGEPRGVTSNAGRHHPHELT